LVHAIILAGGSGSRIRETPVPKQFLDVGGGTVLTRVVGTFARHPRIGHLIVVVPVDHLETAKALLKECRHPKMDIISGGSSRQSSSCHALKQLRPAAKDDDIVIIHDAARLFVTTAIIDRGLVAIENAIAATAAIPCADTMMRGAPNGTLTTVVAREGLYAIQTPQLFRFAPIYQAHLDEQGEGTATDDITLLLKRNIPVKFFSGSVLNFKLTTDEDLALARALSDEFPV